MTTRRKTILTLLIFGAWLACLSAMINYDRQSIGESRTLFRLVVVILLLGGRAIWGKPSKWFWPVAIGALIATPFFLFARAFKHFDIFSVLFHIEFGTEGATLAGLEQQILAAVVSCAFFALTVYWMHILHFHLKSILISAFAVIVLVNPLTSFAYQYITQPYIESDLTERLNTPKIIADSQTPDILLIYLEGLERGFERTDIYGDVFSELTTIEPETVSLTKVLQARGTEWSLAGFTATMCGLPLLPNGLRYRNNYTEQTDFLINHVCLTDVMKDKGYALEFVKGTDATFAGFEHFSKSHGFDRIIDRQAQSALYPVEEVEMASWGWMVDDQMTLDTSRSVYLDLLKDDAPLGMIIETIGPHGRNSYFSRECRDDGIATALEDEGGSVACTLDGVFRFLDFVEENRNGRPTAVMLMSDHLNHSPNVANALDGDLRTNVIMMLGMGFEGATGMAGDKIDRTATMMDVYPTMLSWLGFASPDAKGGLGISLFSKDQTLIEEKGLDLLDRELIPNPELGKLIWN